MKRGIFGVLGSVPKAIIDRLTATEATAKDAEAAAVAAQVAADKAEATGQNARDMVIRRDPTLNSLADVAAQFTTVTEAAEVVHGNLQKQIDEIELTPGPAGKDGADGKDGVPGKDSTVPGPAGKDSTVPGPAGKDGADAYEVARAAGYGGTRTQWLASLKGDAGTAASAAVTNALTERITALEGKSYQIEYRDGIPVPAVVSLLGISADSTPIKVTWSTPFVDDQYILTPPQVTPLAAALIGKTTARVTAKTKTDCTVVVTTTAALAVGGATLSVLAYRKG